MTELVLSKSKKAAQIAFNVLRHSPYKKKTLYDAYGKPSQRKVEAYKYCMDVCRNHDGFNDYIISYNCHFFTFGFIYYDIHGMQHVVYITATNEYDILIDA